DVASVEVTTIPFGARMAEPAPSTMLAAKFSIPYAVAAALVLGRTDIAAFAPPALDDSRIRNLASRVAVLTDATMSPRATDRPTARVRLTLRDGRTLEQTTTVVRGDAASPVGDVEIVEKFLALASPIIGERRAAEAAAAAGAADTLKDVRELTAVLTPA